MYSVCTPYRLVSDKIREVVVLSDPCSHQQRSAQAAAVQQKPTATGYLSSEENLQIVASCLLYWCEVEDARCSRNLPPNSNLPTPHRTAFQIMRAQGRCLLPYHTLPTINITLATLSPYTS